MVPRRQDLVLAVPPLAAAAIVAALVLAARISALLGDAPELYIADVWAALAFPVAGAWLLSRKPRHPSGFVLLASGALALVALANGWAIYDAIDGELRVHGSVAAWFATWLWTPYLLIPTLVPILHVDPRLRGRFTRSVALTSLGLTSLATVAAAFAPGPISELTSVPNPLGVTGAGWLGGVVGACGAITFLVLAPAGVVASALRARRAPRAERARGVVLAAAAVSVLTLATDAVPYPWNDVVTAVGLSLLPLAVVLSVREAQIRREAQLDRELLVRAREDERRRLRRELHDGLGPELAGIRLRLAAASEDIPDGAREGLDDATSRLATVAGDVRRLVNDLRPQALEVGLREALISRCELLATSDCDVTCAADPLPPIPAAVETAAYRIASEALANAVRHARARTVSLSLSATSQSLRVDITDDGTGGAAARDGGIGLGSMRARAAEVGGGLTIESGPGRTTVRADLPLEVRP